jgi:hypothetical protein
VAFFHSEPAEKKWEKVYSKTKERKKETEKANAPPFCACMHYA